MPQYQLPQTPVKQKSRNMLYRRQTIGTSIEVEDPCDISPTLKTKKGRASLGSGCLTLPDPKKIVASPLMVKRRESRKLELNSDSDEEIPSENSGLSSNEGNPGSIKGNDLPSSLDDFFEPVPFFSRVNQLEGEKKNENASVSAALFGIAFDSPAVSPAKLVNPAERFIFIADSPLQMREVRSTSVN